MLRVRDFLVEQYAVALGLGLLMFMLSVGINAESLPFPRGSAYSDAATSHWPNALFLQQSIRAGQFPFWRALTMNGQPFAANPLNKVWYPPQWLAVLLPPSLHLNVLLWLHLLLAGVSMRAFARQIGLTVGIASLIGAAYAFMPRLIAAAGAGHLDVIYAVAWFPVIMLCTDRLIAAPSARSAVWLSMAAAICFLADLRLSVFVFSLAAAYALYRWDRTLSSARGLFLAGAFTIGLTATQWLPLLTLLPKLSRAGLTIEEAGAFSLQAANFIQLFVSDRGGAHETIVYVGLPILLLALIGLFDRKWKADTIFWLVAALFAALYALGVNGFLWPLLIRIVPSLLLLRVPARAWYIALFALLILAGRGLMLLTDPVRRVTVRRWLPILCAILIGIVVACAVVVWPIRPVAAALAIGLAGSILLCFALNRRFGTLIWAVVILIDLLVLDVTLIEGRNHADWLDRYRPLAETLLSDNVVRVYSPSYSLPQQAAANWNIPIFGGVDPFQLADYVKVVETATGVHAKSYSVTLPALEGDPAVVNADAQLNAELLGEWGVSHVVSAFPISNPDLQLLTRVGDVYVYRNGRTVHDQHVRIEADAPLIQAIGLGISALSLMAAGLILWRGSRRVS